ncbi:MAG: guanylate kinase [Clostridia bacterium]|jgi:guanylate kinase|nr:guanylate kinase [Clostridia bacterium]
MITRGLIVVVSGPAGSGKGTVNAELLKTGEFVYSVSATTRAPRPGEVDGVNYHFITEDEFRARLDEGGMLEYTQYCGNFYGTPRKEAEEVLDSGKHLILEIEVDGAMQVKKRYPEAVLIMLLPPSYEVQEQRLRGRATETEDKIRARLEQTKFEVRRLPDYDYVVYNNDGCAIDCAREIQTIVRAESHATKRVPTAASDYFRKKND